MNSLFFLLALTSIIVIAYRNGIFSIEFLIGFVFFIYGFAFYVDYNLFGLEEVQIVPLGRLKYGDANHTYILAFYTSFVVFYTLGIMSFPGKKLKVHVNKSFIANRMIYKAFTISITCLFWYIFLHIHGMERLEKVAFLGTHGILNFIAALGMLSILFVGREVLDRKKAFWYEGVFLFSALWYGLFEGGREVFVYFMLILLPEFMKLKYKVVPFIGLSLVAFLISIWKVVSSYVFVLGDMEMLMTYMAKRYTFSFTYLDPAASLLLLNSYLEGAELYDTLKYSYVLNVLGQIANVFGLIEYESISKRVVEFYSRDVFRRGGGFAFSGILESLLNFGYLGPAIIGYILGGMLRIRKLIFTNRNAEIVFGLILVLLCLKLVRTELAVALKLYVMPFTLITLLFNLRLKSNARKN
jgi:hypothetical protein